MEDTRVWMHLNDEIKVKLTDNGLRILAERNERIKHDFPKLIVKLDVPQVDKFGYAHFLLWEFMNIFGEYLYNGSDMEVIAPLEIHLVKRNVKEMAVQLGDGGWFYPNNA